MMKDGPDLRGEQYSIGLTAIENACGIVSMGIRMYAGGRPIAVIRHHHTAGVPVMRTPDDAALCAETLREVLIIVEHFYAALMMLNAGLWDTPDGGEHWWYDREYCDSLMIREGGE